MEADVRGDRFGEQETDFVQPVATSSVDLFWSETCVARVAFYAGTVGREADVLPLVSLSLSSSFLFLQVNDQRRRNGSTSVFSGEVIIPCSRSIGRKF